MGRSQDHQDPNFTRSWTNAAGNNNQDPNFIRSINNQDPNFVRSWTNAATINNQDPNFTRSWTNAATINNQDPNFTRSWTDAATINNQDPNFTRSGTDAATINNQDPNFIRSRTNAARINSNNPRNGRNLMQNHHQDPNFLPIPKDKFDSTRNHLPFGYAFSSNLPDAYDLGLGFSAMNLGDSPYAHAYASYDCNDSRMSSSAMNLGDSPYVYQPPYDCNDSSFRDSPYVYAPPSYGYNASSLRNMRVNNSAGLYYGPNYHLSVPCNPPYYGSSFDRRAGFMTGDSTNHLPPGYRFDSGFSGTNHLPRGYRFDSGLRSNVGHNMGQNRRSRSSSNQSRFGSNGFHDQTSYAGSDSGHRARWVDNSSMEELRGKILTVVEDQQGVRALQKKIEEGSVDDLEILFSEVKDHLSELMCHQSGNYLIQTLCEVCNEHQMTQLVLLVTSDDRNFVSTCHDMHGTRVIQKMIEHITTARQRAPIVSALRRITIPLTKNSNGNQIIQHCLKFFAPDEKMNILNVVADNCVSIAMDKSGCCVIQECIKEADNETVKRLIFPIVAEAVTLSEHPYGNYVVQYLLGQRRAFAISAVLGRLCGHFVHLSTNKYGSNVVEKCLREAGIENATLVINELISDPEQFLMVVQDPFGNYVAQSAISIAKGGLRHKMIGLVQDHYAFLHSHPHGKRVLACAKPHHRLHRM